MTEQDNLGSEGIAHRNPVMRAGYDVVFHVLTLDHELSDGAFRLYLLLLKYERGKGSCWPGVQRLANDLGKSERTIRRAIEELKDRGLITREQRGLGRTAMTWIEDLRTIYGDIPSSPDNNGQADPNPDKNDHASPDNNDRANPDTIDRANPDNNDRALAWTKMTAKQYQEQEQTSNDDEVILSVQVLSNLRIAQKTAASLAERYTLDRIRSVCEHALRHGDNPAGLAIWMLENEAPVPKTADNDPFELQQCPQCHRMVSSGRICARCGQCLDCCTCDDDSLDHGAVTTDSTPGDESVEDSYDVELPMAVDETTNTIWAADAIQATWEQVLDELEKIIPRAVFHAHLRGSRVLAFADEAERWSVLVSSKASADWLNHRLMPKVEHAIAQVGGRCLEIEFLAVDDLDDLTNTRGQSQFSRDTG